MTYSQTANPNATNSELDAKVIIKHPQLTNDQFGELVAQFVELQVDNMELEDMIEWITDELIYQYGKLPPHELKERIDSHGELLDNEELFDELVENIQITDLMEEVN